MKILHTSDWHLGMMHQTHSLEEDQRYFIDEICGIIEREKIDAVMLCGDVYDRSAPAAEAVKLYSSTVDRICATLHTELLVVAGNHDSPSRLSTYRELVREAGLFVTGELTHAVEPVSIGNADIYMLPWFTTDRVRATYPEEADRIDSMESAYSMVLGHIRSSFNPDRKHILMAHAFVVSAELSESDRSAVVGTAAAIGRSVFEGFDYVALGHIHKPQNIGCNIRYCGTPMKYAFGSEEKQAKSVTILDTETMETRILPLHPLHERLTISGTLDEIRAAAGLSEAQKNGYVRLQISDQFVDADLAESLRAIYPNLLDWSGKSFETGNSGVSVNMEELDVLSGNPVELFRRFCEDRHQAADDRMLALFRETVDACERRLDS